MGSGVDQSEHCLRPVAQQRQFSLGVQGGNGVHPNLHVLALELADGTLVLLGQAGQVTVLDPDDVGLPQCKIHLELDQSAQGGFGGVRLGDDGDPAFQQILADSDQQGGEQSRFAAEMTVDSRSADTRSCAEFLDGDTVVAFLREQRGCSVQHRRAPGGLRGAPARYGARGALSGIHACLSAVFCWQPFHCGGHVS